MTAPGFDPSLRQYLPPSYFDAGGNLTVSEEQATTVGQRVKAHVQDLPPADQQLYLALLSQPDFSPGADIKPGDLEIDLTNLDDAEKILSQALVDAATDNFLGLAEDVDALAKILVIQASQAREQAHEQKKSQLEAAKAALEGQATQQEQASTDIKSAAGKSLGLAIAGSVISIIGSAVQMGGGIKAIRSTAKVNAEFGDVGKELKTNLKRQEQLLEKAKPLSEKEISNLKAMDDKGLKNLGLTRDDIPSLIKTGLPKSEAVELGEVTNKIEKLQLLKQAKDAQMAPITAREQITNGAAQGIEKFGGMMSSLSNYYNQIGQADSQKDQAQGTRFEALSQDFQQKAEMAKDVEGHLDDLVKAMIQAAKDLQDAKAQAMESVTRV